MQKFMLYDTDEGLDFNVPCTPTDLPWVSCRVFRIDEGSRSYFQVIKLEEYLITDIIIEEPIGTFDSFEYAAQAAEYIAYSYREKNRWPKVNRIIQ